MQQQKNSCVTLFLVSKQIKTIEKCAGYLFRKGLLLWLRFQFSSDLALDKLAEHSFYTV